MPWRSQQERSRATREALLRPPGATRAGVITHNLQAAADGGLLVDAPVPVLAQLVFSAVVEAALLVAHIADPAAARVDAERALLTLLSAMVRQPP